MLRVFNIHVWDLFTQNDDVFLKKGVKVTREQKSLTNKTSNCFCFNELLSTFDEKKEKVREKQFFSLVHIKYLNKTNGRGGGAKEGSPWSTLQEDDDVVMMSWWEVSTSRDVWGI